jgi:hypothetical protein
MMSDEGDEQQTAFPWIYATIAFLLLGIERFLYGYVFHFPQDFIDRCRSGFFGKAFPGDDGKTLSSPYWKSVMKLSMLVKVFQFSVVLYDLLVQNEMHFTAPSVIVGAILVVAGQRLNMSAYNALGFIGVYYGYELGYPVKRVIGFPYNLGISDPQYWGVVLTIFGLYIGVGLANAGENGMLIPSMELFWYLTSMQLLEHTGRGGKAIRGFGRTAMPVTKAS